MTLMDHARGLGRGWRWIAGLMLVGVAAGQLWTLSTPRLYRATTDMFVGSVVLGGSGATSAAAQSASQFTLARMQSYAALVGSPGVAAGIAEEGGLGLGQEDFSRRVHATVPPQTVVLRVHALDEDALRSAVLANAVAQRLARTIERLEAPRNGGRSPVKVAVTRPASPPSVPVSPSPVRNVMLGLLAGLAAGLLAAAVLEQSRRSPKAGVASGRAPAAATPSSRAASHDSTPSARGGIARRRLRVEVEGSAVGAGGGR